ncbi:hypothetical protein ACIQOW_27710 [Kitasatospora sp. NPDC091335]|uniref:hypothetical protein n=1 Tax=Kitasatospora sp. NPDC091335 TaxID=3364085 RepID=UPI0037FDC013
MYLVHTALRPDSPGLALPPDARELLLAAALPGDRVEHLVVHPEAFPDPVLGVYLVADSLAEAEGRAAVFCGRVLAAVPGFEGWRAAGSGVPLVAAFYERLLSGPAGADDTDGVDGSAGPAAPAREDGSAGPGRNGPGALPST